MQFTPAGDNQKCHQRTEAEKERKGGVVTEQDVRHQAQWKRQKHSLGDPEGMGWEESLGLLNVPILNVSTRFLNQTHEIL